MVVKIEIILRYIQYARGEMTQLVLVTAQLRLRLHRGIICHLNGNFVGFQNMYDFKRSDH